ncbi:MAG: DUF5711 family protein, partial [Oscillospiraceae bacterium]
KSSRFYRFLAFLVTVGLVAGAVGVVANRDKLNFDALRRFFTYRTTTQDSVGATEPFPYEGGISSSFADLGGDLLCASTSGFRLYSPSGNAYLEETLSLSNPVLRTSGNAAVVYDAGGTQLRVYRDREAVFSLTPEDGVILSASLSSDQWLSVITRATGFKGVVTIYNNKFERVMAFRVSSSYLLGAMISPDHKSVAVLTAGQNGHTFESTLVTYSMSATEAEVATELKPQASLSLGNCVPLDLRWQNRTLQVLTEYGLLSCPDSLNSPARYDWTDRHLKGFSLDGDDFSAVLLGKYRAGSQAQLVTLDAGGAPIATLDTDHQVLSLSAAGRYLAVLTADRLDIYTKDLTLYASLEGTQSARKVVMRPDGTALLVGSESVRVYIPV